MNGSRGSPFDLIDLLIIAGITIASVTLLFSLSPALWDSVRFALDVRQWSRLTWFLVNLAVLVVLVGIRLAPDARQAFAVRRAEAAKHKQRDDRKRKAAEREERLSRRIGR